MRPDSQRLQRVSRRLLAAASLLATLERESRRVPIGSAEFKGLSAEVEAQSRDVFRLSAEQSELARTIEPHYRTLDEAHGPA